MTAGDDGHIGHDRHAGHGAHGELFRRLFWWNLLLAVPVVVSSAMVQEWFGYELTFRGADAIAPVLGTVIFIFGGRPFLTGAADEIRAQPGMMLLIAVAISVAFTASWAATLGVGDLDFWWELAALIVVMLLGHWLEMRAIGQASGALDALAALLPDEPNGSAVARSGESRSAPYGQATSCWSAPGPGYRPTARSSRAKRRWTSR